MNPFDLINMLNAVPEKIQQIDEKVSPIMEKYKKYDTSDIGKIITAATLEWVLTKTIQAGPPAWLAEHLKMTPEQTAKLYDLILTAALRRKNDG